MSASQATQPLEEVDFEAELAALEEEQDAPATQELPAENAEATEEVALELADAQEAPEEEAPLSSELAQEAPAAAAPATASEEKQQAKTAEPSSENEAPKEEEQQEDNPEEDAPSKPAAKKPLVARKPAALKPVAAKKAEPVPAAKPSAPKKGKLLVKKAKVVEEEDVVEDDAAPGPSKKPSLVKKAAPLAAATVSKTNKAPLLPKTKAPALKKTSAPAAVAAAEPTGPLVKGAKNAYIIFSEDNRAKLKEENPGTSMSELAKLLGAAYKELTEEEKAVYVAKAAEDKERVKREIAEGGVVPPRKGKAASAAAAAAAAREKKPAAKRLNNAPYDLFCEEQRPVLKMENPKAGAPELSKLLSEAWKKLDSDEKAPYLQRSKELKAAAKEAAAAAAAAAGEDDEDENDGGPSSASGSKKRTKAPARKGAAGSKRAKVQAAADDDEDEVMPDAGADDEDEDDIDRQNVDWEAHPAYTILSKTKTMYIVARRGLPLYEYGEVPIEAANLQLRGGQTPGTSDKPCPLTLELLNEYDAFCKDFRRDIFDNSEGNELNLEHLRDGSLLEACSFLGSMRESGQELAAVKKDDIWMKVPMMATSRLMQRVIDVERRKNEELQVENEELKAQLAAALAGSGGGAEAVVAVKRAAADDEDVQEAAMAEA